MSTSKKVLTSAWIVLAATPLVAQEGLAKRFSVTVGGGAAIPGRDLRGLMENSPLFRFGFGYRFSKYFQADAGVDAVFHAAGVDYSQFTFIGNLRVRDYEYMAPFGGRAILPLGRVELFGGGGGAYMHYGEQVEVPGSGSDSSYNCVVCRSRGGWGYYATAGAMAAIDRGKRFWVGVETRAIRGRTSGDPLGFVPPFETKDEWINTAAVFMVQFP